MGLAELLRPFLPNKEHFDILNLQTIPCQTHPIVFQEPSTKQEIETASTVKTKHFIALCHNEKVIYALEVLVYFTIHDPVDSANKLLFISKADTNGYTDIKINFGHVTKCILKYLLSIRHEHYLTRVRPRGGITIYGESVLRKSTPVRKALIILAKRRQQGQLSQCHYSNSQLYTSVSIPKKVTTKISLFTRAEPEYLFSNSSSNPGKHVLSGEKLLKWWIRQIDEILGESFAPSTDATLRIPGEDPQIVCRYLNDKIFPNWRVGDIFCTKQNELAVYRIPLLPDDPKGRFLEQLAEEGRILQLRVSNFWTELQAQQEFRLGSTVSVIGVSGTYMGPTFLPAKEEIIIPESRKRFKELISYVTGEEYDHEEGAEEAYLNICDYLRYKTNYSMIHVIGSQPLTHDSNTNILEYKSKRTSPTINSLSVRKRPKV